MGVDSLEITFRAERAFGIRMPDDRVVPLDPSLGGGAWVVSPTSARRLNRTGRGGIVRRVTTHWCRYMNGETGIAGSR